MLDFRRMDVWDLVKGLIGAGAGLGLWVLRREMVMIREHGIRLSAVEKQLTVQEARRELWKELGEPERRNQDDR